MNTTHTYPSHNLEFTHNLDSHRYLQPKHGYKMFFGTLGHALFFFPVTSAWILSDWRHHTPVDSDNLSLCFLSIAFGFSAIFYFPLCQQTRPDKAILWLPAQDKNYQPSLHIRSKDWYWLLAICILFSFLLMILCSTRSLGYITPTQVLQPWNWTRTTPINLKADLACLATDVFLLLSIFLLFFLPQWHIIYTPDDLHIYNTRPILRHTTTILNQPWEQIATTSLIQCNTYNSDELQISSSIKLKDGQEKNFKLPATIFADPCWMTFIANTLTNLTNTTSRQDFLTSLHQHIPTKAKT